MSLHIIELNDRNISLRNLENVLVQSPGFANIIDKEPVFGEEARKVARLHPRQTFTQFWSQLSLDPLVNSNNHFRHQADLAFAHLNAISNEHALKDEVIFAVPSNYNRNQLSILLGLVQSCDFDAVGLVDIPLLVVGSADGSGQAIYLDIQLHQTVLTTFSPQEGNTARDKVIQIPGTGLMALHDAWANMVTDEFIKQSRFDPQHNAETEQYVYNQLGNWINQSLQDNEILMEINNKGSVYQARVNRGHFEQRVRSIFGRVKEELQTLAGSNYTLFLPDDHASLPGVSLYLDNVSKVQEGQLLENCQRHMDQIRGEPGSLSFVTSLQLAGSPVASSAHRPDSKSPSHVLVNNRAYALPAHFQYGPVNGSDSAGKGTIQVEATGSSGDLKISQAEEGVVLVVQGIGQVQLNGSKAAARENLKLGDVIRLPGSDTALQLIQVE
ncbi:MAG: hypothetical protein EBS81_00910 [Gammaproteobacteria bacterium]|nr:hypothetical protein [Gammaproteobacteria bacterium]